MSHINIDFSVQFTKKITLRVTVKARVFHE